MGRQGIARSEPEHGATIVLIVRQWIDRHNIPRSEPDNGTTVVLIVRPWTDKTRQDNYCC